MSISVVLKKKYGIERKSELCGWSGNSINLSRKVLQHLPARALNYLNGIGFQNVWASLDYFLFVVCRQLYYCT